ncbi:unnamed protein product [Owenia fusiformis]|uniref:C-type lectin domain-containing protein n=1 Tax=Owenia fusiformis TaxID=6347 RepID=A0A8S4PVH9_OWEFU|nr:unnamed protein product [Owenia fusiformis]
MMRPCFILLSLIVIVVCVKDVKGDPCKQGSVCPLNFFYNPNLESCYNFVISEKITWYDALTVCAQMDANLAAIETQEELDFLRREIKGREIVGSASNGNSFHLGGNILNGHWQWMGGPSWKTKPISFASWASGQPNALGSQKCTLLYGGDDFKFHNWECHLKFHYICEIKMK